MSESLLSVTRSSLRDGPPTTPARHARAAATLPHRIPTTRWDSPGEPLPERRVAGDIQKKAQRIPVRLVVRRIPDLRPKKDQGQGQLFDVWRFHAFFTTTDPADLGTVAARQDRLFGPQTHAAPAHRLAVGDIMDDPVREGFQSKPVDPGLTPATPAHPQCERPSRTTRHPRSDTQPCLHTHRWHNRTHTDITS